MVRACEREIWRRDDGYYWYQCQRCEMVWSERMTGVHWRPARCPARVAHSRGEDRESAYHGMPEDGQ